ncbi:MAG: Photosystem II manganese-stabilizing polypeptide [Leptolyngbya sp. SIO4C1]|nr:Photosystem II manganese-stabilizing polypeptide [Leptolyngbya sp. SIO4C1]
MRYRALVGVFLALCLGILTACSNAPSASSNAPLTYDQIKDTGLANSCPEISSTRRGSIEIEPGKEYQIVGLCMEPTTYFVKEEPTNKRKEAEFITGKPLTRYTSSLDQVRARLTAEPNGSLTFQEQDGIDFQAITVLLPGGEQIPFLFTVKGLVAHTQAGLNAVNSSTDFLGEYRVPSYRTSNFLDPKGRGLATGYDTAVALPARGDSEELRRENIKGFDVGQGEIALQVEKVDSVTGEIAGTFECDQPSDTDMGTAAPAEVKVQGIFYARVESLEA